jgi:dimethylargininase
MSQYRAIIRRPSRDMAQGERTHLNRVPIDHAVAVAQHVAYGDALAAAGLDVTILPALDGYPDCSFVEDTALILPEIAVALAPGAVSRRGEVATVAAHFPADRPTAQIPPSATIDGGDILVVRNHVFVGLSSRTTEPGVAALGELLNPFGYRVTGVRLGDALHLKTAVTALSDDLLLYNPDWVDAALFAGLEALAIDPREPFAANILRLPDCVLSQSAHPRTTDIVTRAGFAVRVVDMSELAKAEAGLTCSSLIIAPATH